MGEALVESGRRDEENLGYGGGVAGLGREEETGARF
jgi:hypothetical protein